MNRKQQFLLIIYLLIILKPIYAQEDPVITLGKTHFIVGYTEDKEVVQQSTVPEAKTGRPQITSDTHAIPYNLVSDNRVKSAYFSPEDDIRSVLLYLIAQETKSIRIAMFTFTEKKLAQALNDAQLRGVQVEVVVDPSNIYSPYSKLSLLHQGRIKLFVYNANHMQKKGPSLMHNKFALFGNNILGKSLVFTGSLNFTRSAHRSNQENVLVLDDELLVNRYEKKFEQLKESSDHYQERNAVKQTKKSINTGVKLVSEKLG